MENKFISIQSDYPLDNALCIFKFDDNYFVLGYIYPDRSGNIIIEHRTGEQYPVRDEFCYHYVLNENGGMIFIRNQVPKINLSEIIMALAKKHYCYIKDSHISMDRIIMNFYNDMLMNNDRVYLDIGMLTSYIGINNNSYAFNDNVENNILKIIEEKL